MSIEAEIHEGILSAKTYEDLVLFMVKNSNHKMYEWFINLYTSKLKLITSDDGLPYCQDWLARYYDKKIFFLTRELKEEEKHACVMASILKDMSRRNGSASQRNIESIEAAGNLVPVDDEFALAKLACIYNDASAFESQK